MDISVKKANTPNAFGPVWLEIGAVSAFTAAKSAKLCVSINFEQLKLKNPYTTDRVVVVIGGGRAGTDRQIKIAENDVRE